MKPILALIVLWFGGLAAAAPPVGSNAGLAAVHLEIRSGNALSECSGVNVAPEGVILSAEHCGVGPATVTFVPAGATDNSPDSTGQPARRRYSAEPVRDPPKNGRDEVTAFRITDADGPLPFVTPATVRPRIGDAVWTVGFPREEYGGRRLIAQGVLLGNRSTAATADPLFASIPLLGGHSGGPLLNSRGELIGIASTSDKRRESAWIGPEAIAQVMAGLRSRGIAAAAADADEGSGQTVGSPVAAAPLVAFTTNGCEACARFQAHVAAGRYRGYDVVIANYDVPTGAWSYVPGYEAEIPADELYQEFGAATGYPRGLVFPIFWVRGTPEYRVGYEPDPAGGLLPWLARVLRTIVGGIVGEPRPVPAPPASESAAPDGPQSGRSPSPDSATPDDLAERAIADARLLAERIAALQEARTLIGRLHEARQALEAARTVREDATAIRRNPAAFLWGLLALLPGLAHGWVRRRIGNER